MDEFTGGHYPGYGYGQGYGQGYGSSPDLFGECGMAMLLACLITLMVLSMYKGSSPSMTGSRARMTNNTPQYLGSTPGKQVLTGPIADNRPRPALMMAPHQLENYMNLVYPPATTTFRPGTDGVTQCAVSTVNNCPSDLYYKCNKKTWSKEAIGEALALSSVGSYYLPSGVEEENLHKVVALAHDPTQAACANAAGLAPYSGSNPSLAGVM